MDSVSLLVKAILLGVVLFVVSAEEFSWTFEDAVLGETIHVRQERASKNKRNTCYRSLQECKRSCKQKCYHAKNCNNQRGDFYVCSPNLGLILGVLFAVIIFIIIGCCIFCCCCSCCCIAKMMRSRKEKQNPAGVTTTQPGAAAYPAGQQPPASYGGQQQAGYSYPPPGYYNQGNTTGGGYPMQQYPPKE